MKAKVIDVSASNGITMDDFQEMYKRFGAKNDYITILPVSLKYGEWGVQLQKLVDCDPDVHWSEFATEAIRFPKSETLFKPLKRDIFPKKCFMNPGRRHVGERRLKAGWWRIILVAISMAKERRKFKRRQNLQGWSDAVIDDIRLVK